MGQIENMMQEDVESIRKQLEELNKLPREQPMSFKTFPMEDLEFAKRLTSLEEKLEKILSKIDRIFGEAILINGQFKDLKLPNGK